MITLGRMRIPPSRARIAARRPDLSATTWSDWLARKMMPGASLEEEKEKEEVGSGFRVPERRLLGPGLPCLHTYLPTLSS